MIDTSADWRTRPETVDSLFVATGSMVSELVRPVLVRVPVKLGETVAVIVPETVNPARKIGPLQTTVGALGLSAVPGSTGGTTSHPVAPGGGTTETLVRPGGELVDELRVEGCRRAVVGRGQGEDDLLSGHGVGRAHGLDEGEVGLAHDGRGDARGVVAGSGSSVVEVIVVVLVTDVPANCEPTCR